MKNYLLLKYNSLKDRINVNLDEDNEMPCNINSNYYSYHKFNKIKAERNSTFGLMHTNLASINKPIGDLNVSLSLLIKLYLLYECNFSKTKSDTRRENQITEKGVVLSEQEVSSQTTKEK